MGRRIGSGRRMMPMAATPPGKRAAGAQPTIVAILWTLTWAGLALQAMFGARKPRPASGVVELNRCVSA